MAALVTFFFVRLRRTAVLSIAAAAVATLGCGSDGTSPDGRVSGPPFRVVAGGSSTDTVQARLMQPLVVEIHDTTGLVARGKTVRFEALPPDDQKRKNEVAISLSTLTGTSYTAFSADVTDSNGQARALVAFGTFAGTVRLRVSVPELAMVDTVAFTVKPGTPSKFVVGTRDTLVQPGATYSLNAFVVDRFSNPVPTETPSFTPGPGIQSVSATGQVVVGTAIARAQIVLAWRTVTDIARVTVLPRIPLVGTHLGNLSAVALVNTDGTGYTELATSGDMSLSPHAVSATSAVVYYQGDPSNGASVWIVSPGSAPRVLANGAKGFVSASWPRWSPDGAWVYFTGIRKSSSPALYRIKPDGSQIDSIGTISSGSVYTASSVSPDGSTVAVQDWPGIKLINLATRTSQAIATACVGPRYSPDGTRFACVYNGTLSVMNADGTNFRTLGATLDDDLSNADWMPDGRWLIAMSLDAGPELVNATDGTTFPLSRLGLAFFQMSFVR